MSFITEQIQSLRTEASKRKCESVGKTLQRAADTIEELSAKLAAANMLKSTMFYTGGWIPVEKRMPTEKKNQGWSSDDVLITIQNDDPDDCVNFSVMQGYTQNGEWEIRGYRLRAHERVRAWMPLPEAYTGERQETL